MAAAGWQASVILQPLEIYGPSGTRAYVRTGLLYTHTRLGGTYVVHELWSQNDQPDPLASIPRSAAELPGRDIQQIDGIWPDIYKDTTFSVSAAPILHSAPCVGYVVTEAAVPGKIDPKQYFPHLERTGTSKSVMRQLQQGESVGALGRYGASRAPKTRRPKTHDSWGYVMIQALLRG